MFNKRKIVFTKILLGLVFLLGGNCLLGSPALAGEENGDGTDDGFSFTVNQQAEVDLITAETFELYAYAPDAAWIDIYFDADGNRDWHQRIDDEIWETDRNDYYHSGDYRIEAQAWFPEYDEDNAPVMDIDENGNEYHVHYSVEASVWVHVSAPEGNLDFGAIDLPAAYCLGDGLAVTFPLPENGQQMEASIWVEGREEDIVYMSLEDGQDGISFDLSSAEMQEQNLSAGDFLNIRAYANAYGYEDVEYYRLIPVFDPVSEAVLNFDGSEDDTVEVLVNEDIYVTVSSPDEREIRAVRFYDGHEFRWEEGPADDGMFHTGLSFGWPGSYSLFAMVTYDDWNEEWDGTDIDEREWVYTNVLGVDVYSDGNVGPFEISLNSASIVRGDTLEVTFTKSESATNYWIDLWDDIDEDNDNFRRYDWDWVWKDDWHEENGTAVRTAVVSTAGMPAGTYYVSGKANALGYAEYGTMEYSFELLDLEDMPEVLFVVDRTEAVTGEDLVYSAFAEGANRIIVYHDYDQDEGNREERDRDRFAKPVSYSHAGEYMLIACAVYGEEGQEEYRYSEPIIVNISAPEGNLAFDQIDVPGYLVTGQDDLVITFPRPKYAEYVDASIWVENREDGELAYNEIWNDQDSFTLSLDAGELQARGVMPGDVLHIHANARGYGWNQADFDHRIPVVAEPDGGVELIFDEGTDVDPDGEANVLVNQDVQVIIRGTGDRQIQAIRFYSGYEFWDDEGPNADTEHHTEVSFGGPGHYSIYALVTFDERDWVYTNVLGVNVSAYGDVGSFEISLNSVSIVRGDALEVTFTKSESATNYWIDLWDDIDEDNDNFRRYDWDWVWKDDWHEENGTAVRTAVVSTAGMPAGTYYVSGKANALGYAEYGTMEYSFELLDLEDMPEVLFVVDRTEAVTGEDLVYSAFAEGANRIIVYHDYDQDEGNREERDRDRFAKPVSYSHAGEHTLIACAVFGEEGQEEYRYSEPVIVNISAPNGDLAFGEIEVPGSLCVGQDDLVISFARPERAEYVDASIWVENREDGELAYGEI